MDMPLLVSKEKAIQIATDYEPIGKFLAKDGLCWVAIDNSRGDCYSEEFVTFELALQWLK